jgi:hypothetical protein
MERRDFLGLIYRRHGRVNMELCFLKINSLFPYWFQGDKKTIREKCTGMS